MCIYVGIGELLELSGLFSLQPLWPSGDILPKGSLTIQSLLNGVCLAI